MAIVCESIKRLQSELRVVSKRIYELKEIICITENPENLKELQSELKQLQFQALFYIEKIDNLS